MKSSNPFPRILIADDQPDVLEALRLLLKSEGFQTETAASPAQIMTAIETRDFDVALIDLNYTRDTTSGQEGLDLLAQLQAMDTSLPIVVMTAWGSVDLAVEAMRRGARDFVQKPWENERLISILKTQIELGQALRKGQRLEAENQLLRSEHRSKLIAEAPSMQPVLQVIARVGPSDANVLITGENGTGKGVVASVLHSISHRANKPLVTVNVGGLSEGVFESELFGHIKGAYTDAKTDRVGRFELADEGTLFLDEIADLPLAMQVKLLRAIQEKSVRPVGGTQEIPVNVRIISATHKNLAAEVSAGHFRQDLFYRINVIQANVPPLRERGDDILYLTNIFLKRLSQEWGVTEPTMSEPARQTLLAYRFPGNVRELQNILERALTLCDQNTILPEHLQLPDHGTSASTEAAASATEINIPGGNLEDYLLEVEKSAILRALDDTRWNRTAAAKKLGMTFRSLRYRLKKMGLDDDSAEEE